MEGFFLQTPSNLAKLQLPKYALDINIPSGLELSKKITFWD